MVFAPGELLAPGWLYIVHRGIALFHGRVYTAGRAWGADMILHSTHLRQNYAARALNYLEVYAIDREELLQTAHAFPQSYRRIRKYAIYLALRRDVIRRVRLPFPTRVACGLQCP